MAETVSAHTTRTRRLDDHYLEVRLEGLRNAPPECHSIAAMTDFVSQIAPVPYAADFPFSDRLDEAAREANIAIEQVRISVRDGRKRAIPITKPYGKSHRVGTKTAPIDDCEIVNSPSGNLVGLGGQEIPVRCIFGDARGPGSASESETSKSTRRISSERFFAAVPSPTRAFRTTSSAKYSSDPAPWSRMHVETTSRKARPGESSPRNSCPLPKH